MEEKNEIYTPAQDLMQYFDFNKVRPLIVPERYDFPHGRMYRATDPEHGNIWRASVTTFCGIIDPGPGIRGAMLKAHGPEEWKSSMNEKAELGTLVHKLCADMATGKQISTEELPEAVIKRLLSFRQFWLDYQPELVAAEIPLIHPLVPWAGSPDLILKIGDEHVLVDIKTGTEWETYPVQLKAYEILIQKCLNITIDRKYCLYLKEWRGNTIPEPGSRPKYNLKKDGGKEISSEDVYAIYSIWKMFRWKDPELPTEWPKRITLNEENEEAEKLSECCGAPLIGSEPDQICSECKEHI